MRWVDTATMLPLSFTVMGDPVSQGSMKVVRGKPIHQKQAQLVFWRHNILQKALVAARAHEVPVPINEPVALEMRFYMHRHEHTTFEEAATRPDLDKLVRAVNDGLAPIKGYKFLREDSRVIAVNASKEYAKTNRVGDPEGPRVEITVYRFKGNRKKRGERNER
ncbi:RusA family crossover junction endodeoxyribonuclease [Varibaculum cambriense]|uniref:Uncharacterized protein n=1 Tax=Varibaculum cambriense TaxID=184870 RepID=A0ABX4UNG8_9ACTO|nr:RusA family crossover junction endodeoxyribonuclease [Varibaculum cambriense]PMB89248.1 hypothetical protein CJ240_05640 [Varibaculum cambriense]